MTPSQLTALHSGLIIFLVTWPVVVLVQLAGRRRARTVMSGAVVTLYASLAVAIVLLPLPGPHTHRPVQTIQLVPFQWVLDFVGGDPRAFTQVVLNVLLFVPVGVFARTLWRRNLRQAVLIGFAFALLIEITQLTANFGTAPFAYRIFDVDDLMTNTLGAAFGWIVANALVRVPDPVRAMPLPKDRVLRG
ncbi:VanZ family protein [Actinocrispum wychmicini]|uniref:Glycopeptide antibiotics resistance protein n=1 Tax=Actinocrispum wychmicini TaxID=1213861 RepID=A0A4R2K1C4_9PSEU|nr:VanZ family protein [Actinocrispum wychmicini]TCO65497.1 glycopeptide antibiotics resistance protein [Actinocrispum wychmicini]